MGVNYCELCGKAFASKPVPIGNIKVCSHKCARTFYYCRMIELMERIANNLEKGDEK